MEKMLKLRREMSELKIEILEREIKILKSEKEQIAGSFLMECDRLLDEEIDRKLTEIDSLKSDGEREDDEIARFIFEF